MNTMKKQGQRLKITAACFLISHGTKRQWLFTVLSSKIEFSGMATCVHPAHIFSTASVQRLSNVIQLHFLSFFSSSFPQSPFPFSTFTTNLISSFFSPLSLFHSVLCHFSILFLSVCLSHSHTNIQTHKIYIYILIFPFSQDSTFLLHLLLTLYSFILFSAFHFSHSLCTLPSHSLALLPVLSPSLSLSNSPSRTHSSSTLFFTEYHPLPILHLSLNYHPHPCV